MINDSDQLGLELHVHAEDDDEIAQIPRPALPVLMWTPSAALELSAISLSLPSSSNLSSPSSLYASSSSSSSSLLTACPLLVIAVGDKAVVFWSLLAAANATWHTEAVATLVTPHAPVVGCAGYAAAAAVPAPHAASTSTLYRVSPRRDAPAAFLYWSELQPTTSSVQLSSRAEDAAHLAEALVGALPRVPRRTLVLDTLPAAHFCRDDDCNGNGVGHSSAHGIYRVLESHAAASYDAYASTPPLYLSSASMLDSISAAMLATLQMRGAWCRAVVGVDRDADPCEAVIALAAAGSRLIVPLLTEVLDAATVASATSSTASAAVVHGVSPVVVGAHTIVRQWLATRAKRAHPHM